MGGVNSCPCCGHALAAPDLLMVPDRRLAVMNGQSVRLSRSKYRLLEALHRAWPRAVSMSSLVESVWQTGEPDSAEQVVRSHVSYLRVEVKRLGIGIDCEHSFGYRLALPEGIKTQKAA